VPNCPAKRQRRIWHNRPPSCRLKLHIYICMYIYDAYIAFSLTACHCSLSLPLSLHCALPFSSTATPLPRASTLFTTSRRVRRDTAPSVIVTTSSDPPFRSYVLPVLFRKLICQRPPRLASARGRTHASSTGRGGVGAAVRPHGPIHPYPARMYIIVDFMHISTRRQALVQFYVSARSLLSA